MTDAILDRARGLLHDPAASCVQDVVDICAALLAADERARALAKADAAGSGK